ncbi:hypothetical protein PR202_gb24203 [Eleusine coracana subsp. coracana]|uniref:DUF6598 domain-containing protein n=1 Tax=Eleusine coracana subsp. coracana TaxID=191504 RepID=A0AAV5FKB2_ELECO|nr:hypothetical protein QOZ80_5BG0445750 [Eleusine coracana subsp. coracana]GJN35426.1 hypothetical protein PR202_gb24203 [Eleusine coracana subsp. coracana]
MERAGGATTEPNPMKRKPAEETLDPPDEKEAEEGKVMPVELLQDHKYADIFPWLYRLNDTSETSRESMMISLRPEEDWERASRQQVGCHMLQIFSLKLSSSPSSITSTGPIQLYGFMALRDPIDPLRNYVFKRNRDDPFIVQDLHSDPFIYLSAGPKRGVYVQNVVLLEYDIKIKTGGDNRDHHHHHQHQEEEQDSPLINGVAVFSLPMWTHGPVTNRITGDRGVAVDISRCFIHNAVEITVQVFISELKPTTSSGGINLSITGRISKVTGEIKVFHDVVDQPCELNKFVVAVGYLSCLFLQFDVPGTPYNYLNLFAFKARRNGSLRDRRELHFATVDVIATCSILH